MTGRTTEAVASAHTALTTPDRAQAAPDPDRFLAEIRAALPDDAVSVGDDAAREASRDRSHHDGGTPFAVVRCRDTDEVVRVVRTCAAHRVPIVPRGAGTGLEGGANAIDGCVVVDLRPMDRILAVHAEDFDAVVQPGVMKSALNRGLAEDGLFFPAGPGVDASFGGMLSTRASGTNAVRYGTMRENVLGLTVVLADGSVIRTGSRTRKSAAGYDLTHLLVGAEGTLGIITEAIVRVHGIPPHTAAMICAFPDLRSATALVYRALKAELPVARVELIDDASMRAINRYTGSTFTEAPTLVFEVQGSTGAVADVVTTLTALADEAGATGVRSSEDPDEIARIWSARHDALPASAALVPGSHTWSTDVCVPISRLAECIALTQADVETSGLLAPIVGHVGDGNFHLAFVLPDGDHDAFERAVAVNERLVDRALGMEGTCSGEHGIGRGKRHSLRAEHGDLIPVMVAIKNTLDPHHIMNPGALFEDIAPGDATQHARSNREGATR